MKKFVLLFALGLVVGSAGAQKLKNTEVPDAVKNAFTKRFPTIKNVAWSKESENEFEAEFKNNGKEQSVNFDQTGMWLVTETEIKKSELPAEVTASISKEFAGFKIEEAELAETASQGTFYEVELEKRELSYEVQFNKDGKVLKREQEKESEKGKKSGKK
jgi:uncharacterized membrane protein YkoI